MLGHRFVHSIVHLLVITVLFSSLSAMARTQPRTQDPVPRLNSSEWLRQGASAPGKAAVDTIYLLGGPDRLDGSFEDALGQPHWHGWTSEDLTFSEDNHWHVSRYWAYGLNGHGADNHALVCVDESLPACSAADTVGGVTRIMNDHIGWVLPVPDPTVATTLRLTGHMHHDLELGYDYLYLLLDRGDEQEQLAFWTGTESNLYLDIETVLQPGEYFGPDSDSIRLSFRVNSDGAWDDSDCQAPGHGACQLDDLTVFFDGQVVSFDDFEPGNPVSWSPYGLGVGNFASLKKNLNDIDPCRHNTSVQINFIDDGLVVPGVGPSLCQEFCYGPGGHTVNFSGGLMAADTSRDWFLNNRVVSPPIAIPEGYDGAQLDFDAYMHELFTSTSPGIGILWYVRSTDSQNPDDLAVAEWQSRNLLYIEPGKYRRFQEGVSDLMVPDAQWAQIALRVWEFGSIYGVEGENGTPAPYFDNVAFRVWAPEGPEIQVRSEDNFVDAFPEQGFLDAADLASNSCRIDANRHFDSPPDELEATISWIRDGAEVLDEAHLHYVMLCNPVFDSVRPQAPGPDGLLRGSFAGQRLTDHYSGGDFAFDLPDSGWFFPGDRLRYFITASDMLNDVTRTSVWPADTTGVTSFTEHDGFPRFAEIRALPAVTGSDGTSFNQPAMLLVNDSRDERVEDLWMHSLGELGFAEGDCDLLTSRWSNAALSTSLSAANLAGYEQILLTSGAHFSSVVNGVDPPFMNQILSDWLDQGDKGLLLAGDYMVHLLEQADNSVLLDRALVMQIKRDISDLYGGQRVLRVNPVAGNGIIADGDLWDVEGNCPDYRSIGAIQALPGALPLATLDLPGQPGGSYAAAVTVHEQDLNNRITVLPFDLIPIGLVPGHPNSSAGITGRSGLLEDILNWHNAQGTGSPSGVPEAVALDFQVAPNPFNPTTSISFVLEEAEMVDLAIYDIQGRLVRQLVRAELPAGARTLTWDGTDQTGRHLSSGLYLYRFSAGPEQRLGKLTLLK